MKSIVSSLMGVLFCALVLPASAATANIESVYTSLDTKDCKTLEESTEGSGYYKARCSGTGGYQLDLEEGDIRQTLNVISPDGQEFPLELESTVSGGFSGLDLKAEWRVKKEGGKNMPVALIVRFNVSNPEKPEKSTSYLVVSKITDSDVCVTDVVKPSSDANQQARNLADVAADKACINKGDSAKSDATATSARFLCKADEQVVFGCNSKDKIISLCASSDVSASKGYLQYRFGKLDSIELAYPEQQEPPKGNFWYSSEPYSGGYSDRVRFKNGTTQYVVFEDMISHGAGSPDKDMRYGVTVLMPGKEKGITRLCDGSGVVGGEEEITQGFVYGDSMDLGDLMDKEEFNFDLPQ